MNSRFKFPRRVRIHGGECGAVARALHHKVKSSSLPAVKEIVSFTTKERKSMSTKTSLLKRIAQTAVVALLGGLMATVATPAANAASNASISASCVARAGLGGVIKVNVNGDGALSIRAKMTDRVNAVAGTDSAVDSTVISTGLVDSNMAAVYIPLTAETVTANKASATYTIWLDPKDDAYTTLESLPASGVKTSVTCTFAGAPRTFTLSSSSASIAAGETATFTITPKDAAGNTTLLAYNYGTAASNDTITLTASSTASGRINLASGAINSTTGVANSFAAGYGNFNVSVNTAGDSLTASNRSNAVAGPTSSTNFPTISLLQGNADAGWTGTAGSGIGGESVTATGAFTVHVSNLAAGTTTVSVAGVGGIAAATSSSFTLTTTSQVTASYYGFGTSAVTTAAGFGIKKVAADGTYGDPGLAPTATVPAQGNTDSATYKVDPTKTSIVMTLGLSADGGTLPYTVAAATTGGVVPSGITTGSYTLISASDSITTLTFTSTAPAAGQGFKVTWRTAANVDVTATFVYEARTVSSSLGTVTLSNSGKALNGSTNSVSATVTDQYGNPASGAAVIWSRTGRNATLSNVSSTTDVNGQATHTWTDANPTSTTLTDTVSFQASLNASTYTTASTKTFTYVASLDVTTLRLTNAASSDGVAASLTGTNATCVLVTATALDANGAALASFPVVLSGSDSTYYNKTSNSVTVYTASGTGVATAYFCGDIAGTATITATSGGKTATTTWDVIAAAARTVSIDAATLSMAPGESKRVTATVKDAYGNAVEDASVSVKYVGTAGRVSSVNGVASASADTDADGKVTIEISGDVAGTGTLTVTITAGDLSTATTLGNGSAYPAKVASVTSAATISGTAASVAAAEAATDAAAEAIDAANAATDAANLAAEAADAATVAAEEARDAADAATAAVEELATQVATLMAALKAQITTLANTVAKIAKKVKA